MGAVGALLGPGFAVGLLLGSVLGPPKEVLGKLVRGARRAGRRLLPWRRRPVRVYLDGCFDLAHYGHANALRQAAACGDELVVGICSDAEIERNKGPPVLTLEEREGVIRANKWVTEVISGTPYELSEEFLETLFTEHRVDFILHGDDPCLLPDGSDAYAAVKAAGRFKTIKRTEGVSTTDIVGRMLLSESGSIRASAGDGGSRSRGSSTSRRGTDVGAVAGTPAGPPLSAEVREASASPSPGGSVSTAVVPPAEPKLYNFLPTSHRILQFSSGRVPSKSDRVVYLMGDWDMFNWGHVQLLKAARELGDFLVVGVLGDEIVKRYRGRHHPILNLQERTLSVLACKHVDEVIMGCPWEVSGDMLTTFNISVVVRVVPGESGSSGTVVTDTSDGGDPLKLPESRGLVREIAWSSTLSVPDIIARVIANRAAFEAKYERKAKSEKEYVAGKAFVAEK